MYYQFKYLIFLLFSSECGYSCAACHRLFNYIASKSAQPQRFSQAREFRYEYAHVSEVLKCCSTMKSHTSLIWLLQTLCLGWSCRLRLTSCRIIRSSGQEMRFQWSSPLQRRDWSCCHRHEQHLLQQQANVVFNILTLNESVVHLRYTLYCIKAVY